MLSREQCFTRLRTMGQPITLFAETDQVIVEQCTFCSRSVLSILLFASQARYQRTMKCQAAQGVLDEDMHDGQRNDFMRDIENRGKETKGSAFNLDEEDKEDGAEGKADDERTEEEVKETKPKTLTVEGVIIDWIKAALKEWERHLEARSDEEKAHAHGRADTAMQKQTRRYLKVLFEKLQNNTCPGDIISKVSKMINLVDKRLYLKANDE